jgi:hypothetical protein
MGDTSMAIKFCALVGLGRLDQLPEVGDLASLSVNRNLSLLVSINR